MAKLGLNRLPYYPQLTVLTGGKHNALTLVLSALLFWNTRDVTCRFQKKQHLYQLSLHLKLDREEVAETFDELYALGLIYDVTELFLRKKDPVRLARGEILEDKYEERTFTFLDLKKLETALHEHGEDGISVHMLSHAADDSFELYDVINQERLPLVQYLVGQVTGEDFERTALNCARLATALADRLSDFALKAVAPGWRMLLQPPATAEDIASRWLRADERAIDLEFADGTIFLPDSRCFGASEHHVSHHGDKIEPRIFAAAFLLAASAECPTLHYISPLPLGVLKDAAALLFDLTGLCARLEEEYYFKWLYLPENEKHRQLENWQCFLKDLSKPGNTADLNS